MLKVERLSLKDIKPYTKNAKKHPQEQIEQIKKSIEQFGMNDPIAIWGEDNLIVEGHGRYEALKQLGFEEVDCIRLDHLTDNQRKAYTLAHNKLTMNTDFDFAILEGEIFQIEDIDLSDFGFDLDNLDVDISDNEYDEPELKENTTSLHVCPQCGCEFQD